MVEVSPINWYLYETDDEEIGAKVKQLNQKYMEMFIQDMKQYMLEHPHKFLEGDNVRVDMQLKCIKESLWGMACKKRTQNKSL